MSDISIPGVTGRIDTKAMVDALMEPDRAKLQRKEEEIQGLQDQKRVWQDLRGRLSKLDDAARSLYSFQNPFGAKTAITTDEMVIRATATREAARESHSFRVIQTAKADRFLSEPVASDFQAPAGTYRFQVGEDEVSFRFDGGSLRELADTVNRRAGRLLSARVIKNTQDTSVFLLESKKEGAANAVVFQETAAEFGTLSGMLRRSQAALTAPALQSAAVRGADGSPLDIKEEPGLLLQPGATATLPFPTGQAINENVVLEIEVTVADLPEEEFAAPAAPSGPTVGSSGEGVFQGHSVQNEPSQFTMPRWTPPEAPRRVDDPRLGTVIGSGRTLELPELSPGQGKQVLRIPVGEALTAIERIELSNRNTHREIMITDLRLYDPTSRGDHRAANALSEAQDAILEMDGIRVTRATNEIDDLLPGVNITLEGESDREVELEVDTDVDAIKDTLIEFVGYYNQLLTQVDILSRTDEQVVEDVTYFTEDEREKAFEQLGMLQGDLSLNQMKNRLRTTLVSPYPTSAGRELSMLVQIGIAADTSRPGSSGTLSGTKLRGYLEIDEERLEEALARDPEAVGELFGSDTDGDFVVDNGAGYAISQSVRPYTTTGGLIGSRLSGLDTTMARRQRDLETMNRQIENKEAKLRREYTMMEGMLDNLERSSQAIENFNRAGSRDR
jgi:flagellar hook-associated protein 2